MRIVLSAYVEGDLDEIAAYIAVDNPSRAVSFIDEITGRFQKIWGHSARLPVPSRNKAGCPIGGAWALRDPVQDHG